MSGAEHSPSSIRAHSLKFSSIREKCLSLCFPWATDATRIKRGIGGRCRNREEKGGGWVSRSNPHPPFVKNAVRFQVPRTKGQGPSAKWMDTAKHRPSSTFRLSDLRPLDAFQRSTFRFGGQLSVIAEMAPPSGTRANQFQMLKRMEERTEGGIQEMDAS